MAKEYIDCQPESPKLSPREWAAVVACLEYAVENGSEDSDWEQACVSALEKFREALR